MPSGWTRLVLENFEFPYDRVFPPDIDRGGLRAKYDVIVFNGAGLQIGGGGGRGGGRGAAPAGERRPQAATRQERRAAQAKDVAPVAGVAPAARRRPDAPVSRRSRFRKSSRAARVRCRPGRSSRSRRS